MKTTPYLIQRLEKSRVSSNPFTFGGGMKNGGLSDEAMSMLSTIWSYDYMGSAEFELGALPKSFQRIVENISDYTTGSITVNAKAYSFKMSKDIESQSEVFYVCLKQDEGETIHWIEKFANSKDRHHLKERLGFRENICGLEYADCYGWHDIDNDYLFFTNQDMFDGFCQLFELKSKVS